MDNYSQIELQQLLGKVGSNVLIHRTVVFFNPKKIFIESNVRIDCFCILSAGLEGIFIGNYIHLGASTHLFGSGGRITLDSFCNISSRVSIFTASDDYKEGYLTNPTVPFEFKNVSIGQIKIEKHVIVGCGSVIMPGITIFCSSAVGALSFVNKDVLEFSIVAGIPIKQIGIRKSPQPQEELFLASCQLNSGS